MSVNGRNKGQRGEREAGVWLGAVIGVDLARNLEQTRDGGGDHLGIEGLCIEVKRQETLNVNGWWRQVCRAADNRGDLPVLMYRRNRERWQFCLPASLLIPGLRGRISMGEEEFAGWLREWVR